jgi:hypothetical protein
MRFSHLARRAWVWYIAQRLMQVEDKPLSPVSTLGFSEGDFEKRAVAGLRKKSSCV